VVIERCLDDGQDDLIGIAASNGSAGGMAMAKRAFTLIELLVVIAVIAVLMAVLMPALQRAREQGKRAVCLSNVKQFGLSWVMYADENDQKLVNSCTVPGTEGHPSDRLEPCWLYYQNGWSTDQCLQGVQDGAMWPYIGQLKIYKCPTGIRGEVNTYMIVDAMNGATSPLGIPVDQAPPGVYVKRRTEIKRPGDRMVFVDEGKTSPQSWTIHYSQASWWDTPPVRHGDGTNFSFADGHAEYWKWQDVRTVKLAKDRASHPDLVALSDNPDIQRVQRAFWGQLGYDP
jgi:prepilin-type N-terminal cleavage/methylation domain-containing protein/prepilin-type processing-associated H-X9-DG protein